MEKMNTIKLKEKGALNEINNLFVESSSILNQLPVFNTTVSSRMENPFERLSADLSEIKMMLRLILQQKELPVEKSDLIDIDEAAELIRVSKSTIYKMTADKKIPFFKRAGSSKLIFSRNDLDTWVKESPVIKVNLVEEHLHKNLRVRKAQFN